MLDKYFGYKKQWCWRQCHSRNRFVDVAFLNLKPKAGVLATDGGDSLSRRSKGSLETSRLRRGGPDDQD